MRRTPLLLAVLLAAPAIARAQALAPAAPDPRAPLFVTTSWLSGHAKDANLVLLHVGDPKDYATTHIAGARLVSTQDVSVSDRSAGGLVLEMPSPDTLRAHLAALGISDDSRIILYYGKDWVSQTTRILLTLAWAGLGDRTSMLDGGMGAWTADGHATTAELPAATTGTLAPLKIRNFVVDASYVQSMIGKPGVSIVDARLPAFYEGTQTGGSTAAPHKTGHITGAKSVPFSTVTDESARFRSPAELAELFSKAGIGPHDVIIGYCHLGQQATAMLTAARSLGHPILLYDGSFQDWSARADSPVETGPAKKLP
ncbi:MAG: rhodanese-like domain-containing protein [Gemmatimonadetes bacterium]|nr:rhodanese-like domain-containing protein [Gemmatimonadota bacterium]